MTVPKEGDIRERSSRTENIGGDIVIDSVVEGKFHFVPDIPPKIEFRYVVEFEPYVPTPESYDVEKPLEELTNDDLMAMATIDAENADVHYMLETDQHTVYVEVIIDGTIFRRVKS